MKVPIILEPHDHARLTADYLKAFPLPTEIDLIEVITRIPNAPFVKNGTTLSHAWNEYGLKPEVVEKVLQGK